MADADKNVELVQALPFGVLYTAFLGKLSKKPKLFNKKYATITYRIEFTIVPPMLNDASCARRPFSRPPIVLSIIKENVRGLTTLTIFLVSCMCVGHF